MIFCDQCGCQSCRDIFNGFHPCRRCRCQSCGLSSDRTDGDFLDSPNTGEITSDGETSSEHGSSTGFAPDKDELSPPNPVPSPSNESPTASVGDSPTTPTNEGRPAINYTTPLTNVRSSITTSANAKRAASHAALQAKAAQFPGIRIARDVDEVCLVSNAIGHNSRVQACHVLSKVKHTLHSLFDDGAWGLLPISSKELLDLKSTLKNAEGSSDYLSFNVPGKTYDYILFPFPSIDSYEMTIQRWPETRLATKPKSKPEDPVNIQFPYAELPIILSHIHPCFAIYNLGKKFDKADLLHEVDHTWGDYLNFLTLPWSPETLLYEELVNKHEELEFALNECNDLYKSWMLQVEHAFAGQLAQPQPAPQSAPQPTPQPIATHSPRTTDVSRRSQTLGKAKWTKGDLGHVYKQYPKRNEET